MDLLRAGVEAALDTHLHHLHAKAEAIGRSVRTGVSAADTARVDEARLVVRALAVLEAAHVYFTTKGTNQVFDLDVRRSQLELIYDDDMVPDGRPR